MSISLNFTTVTELSGDAVSAEQVDRMAHRYYWAAEYCRNKDVLEVACGTGQGLGYLASVARSVRAGDITASLVSQAQKYYGDRVCITEMDAHQLPFESNSFDVIILFEAIYYLASAEQFVDECQRVLRFGGTVLIATANKDLYDFNPSPFSHCYYGVVELAQLFRTRNFTPEVFGYMSIGALSFRQRVLRPIKKLVVGLSLMPKTMAGKKLLKHLVFGKLVSMPSEITEHTASYVPPLQISFEQPNKSFKAIYCAATLDV